MSEELVYDPRTKQMIKDKIYSHIYDPINCDYAQRLETIITKNSSLHGNNQRWMLFRGNDYTLHNAGNRPLRINRCHQDVKPLMQEYVNDLTKLNNEELPFVLGFINHTLNSSNSFRDYFKVFPDSVHQPIRDLVDQCGCRTERLTEEKVDRLKSKYEASIELIKKRMVLNLLL